MTCGKILWPKAKQHNSCELRSSHGHSHHNAAAASTSNQIKGGASLEVAAHELRGFMSWGSFLAVEGVSHAVGLRVCRIQGFACSQLRADDRLSLKREVRQQKNRTVREHSPVIGASRPSSSKYLMEPGR